jgi:hypothetical protein
MLPKRVLLMQFFVTPVARLSKNKLYPISVSALIILLSATVIIPPLGKSGESDTLICSIYSCDAAGVPQDLFPRKSTAYFNVTVRNLAQIPQNISLHLTLEDALQVPVGTDELATTVAENSLSSYIMSVFIPLWAYVGFAKAYISVWEGTIPIDSKTTDLYIAAVDTAPPQILIMSPRNTTYNLESVPLVFTVNERTSWTGYSPNNTGNVTISGNTTVTGLVDGSYRIVVYANDTSNNMGSSVTSFIVLITHDVAILALDASATQVYVGETLYVTALVRNEGTVNETFIVTAYANSTTIQSLIVAQLQPTNQTSVAFAWNTTGFSKGNYSLSASIPPLPKETDTTDNNCTDSFLSIITRPDIRVATLEPSRTLVGHGYTLKIMIETQNQGDNTETFNLTTYANTTQIQTQTLTLTPGETLETIFVWNTSDFAMANYTVSAYALPLPGEIDVVDNIFTYETVKISCIGDVNGDLVTDGKDLVLVKKAQASMPGSINWNLGADINDDSRVDVKDYQIVKSHIPSQAF